MFNVSGKHKKIFYWIVVENIFEKNCCYFNCVFLVGQKDLLQYSNGSCALVKSRKENWKKMIFYIIILIIISILIFIYSEWE